MEQEWLRLTEDYLTSESVQNKEAAPLSLSRSKRKGMWDNVGVVGPTVDIQEQRIILSTLGCIVYDPDG